MIPVLAVSDPEAACAMLAGVFGFEPRENGVMMFGNHAISLVQIGAVPGGMLRMPLDHVAFSVTDADRAHLQFMARGGNLARSFTPDGPKDIPEFWDHGVRFVFFDGPDGWPFEFCMKKGAATGQGHDHFAIRKANITTAVTALGNIGCIPVAHFGSVVEKDLLRSSSWLSDHIRSRCSLKVLFPTSTRTAAG